MSYAGIATIIYLVEALIIAILILVIVMICKSKRKKEIAENNSKIKQRVYEQERLKEKDYENEDKITNSDSISDIINATSDIMQDDSDSDS